MSNILDTLGTPACHIALETTIEFLSEDFQRYSFEVEQYDIILLAEQRREQIQTAQQLK